MAHIQGPEMLCGANFQICLGSTVQDLPVSWDLDVTCFVFQLVCLPTFFESCHSLKNCTASAIQSCSCRLTEVDILLHAVDGSASIKSMRFQGSACGMVGNRQASHFP